MYVLAGTGIGGGGGGERSGGGAPPPPVVCLDTAVEVIVTLRTLIEDLDPPGKLLLYPQVHLTPCFLR